MVQNIYGSDKSNFTTGKRAGLRGPQVHDLPAALQSQRAMDREAVARALLPVRFSVSPPPYQRFGAFGHGTRIKIPDAPARKRTGRSAHASGGYRREKV
jgi:hypothetical protein